LEYTSFHSRSSVRLNSESTPSDLTFFIPNMLGAETIYGGASIRFDAERKDDTAINAVLDVLETEGIKRIDTAQIYGNSEEYLGKVKASSRFTIDTKVGGALRPGTATKEGVVKAAKESMQKLGTNKVDVYYIHTPDQQVPITETLAGIQEVYEAGHFSRFGLSNFEANDVRKIYDHCKAYGYVLPSVYQGNYNAVARAPETALFPTLRELGISFYAYSPIAGGFLTKTREQILEGAGRFSTETYLGKIYNALYSKPSYLEALSKWEAVANEAGCSRAELAYRWVKYNSALSEKYGDGFIIGASSTDQLKETLRGLKNGPLGEKECTAIDEIWQSIKHDAPVDNFHSFIKLQ